MAGIGNTPKLDLLRIQADWQFGDEAFNRFIDDADNKLVGFPHLASKAHWDLWKKDHNYAVDDLVRWENMKSHQYARCIQAGVSDGTTPENNITGSIVTDNEAKWQICSLTETDAYSGTIKIWLSGSYYNRGDAVRYGSALYRCTVSHTATNWNADNSKWQEIFASIRFWESKTYYFAQDTVVYNNLIFKCVISHMSETAFTVTEEDKWELVADIGVARDWHTGTDYKKDQLVLYMGILYRAKENHTSSVNGFSADSTKWETVFASIPSWGEYVYYPVNTVVNYEGKIYKCVIAHTSSVTTLYDDGANWQILDNTVEEWATNIYYYSGQLVLKENILYKCNTNHKASNFVTDIAKWDLVYANIQTWATGTYYKVNSLVIHEGKMYLCITAHTSDVFDDEVANWKMVGGGNASITEWESDKVYEADNVVTYKNQLYRCLANHTSGESFDITKWKALNANIPSWTADNPYKVGQVVLKDNRLYVCTTDHTSNNSFDGSKFANLGGIRSWSASTYFSAGEIIKYEDNLYYVDTAFTSGETFSFSNLSFFNITRLLDWTANKQYPVGSIVLSNGIVYYSNVAHKSSADFVSDKTKWVALSGNIQIFASGRYYPVGSTVVHNGKLYKAILENNGDTDPVLGYYWEEISNRGITPWQPKTDDLHRDNYSSLLHFDTTDITFDEIITNTWAIQISSGLDTTKHKFGAGCMSCGNWFGRYIYTNNVADILGTTTLENAVATIDFWVWTEGGMGTVFETVPVQDGTGNMVGTDRITATGYTSNQWNHIALVLDNGTCTEYVNGVSVGTFDVSGTIRAINLGRISDTNNYTWIDEFRVTTDIRYTGDFEVPTEPALTGRYGYYEVDDYVSYNNKLYRCIVRNADQTFDNAKWELLYSGVDGIHEWVADTEYATGAFVIYNNQLYECITGNADSTWTGSKWKYINETPTWASNTYYPVNMLIIHNGSIYRCKTAHTSTTTFDADKFDRLAGQIASITNWVAQKEYLVNDTVIYNSQLYHCKTAHTSTNSFDATKWDLIDASISPWRAGVAYKVNQNVVYNGNIYRCNTAHTSSSGFGANIANWTILCSLKEWASDTVYKTNEVVLHGSDIYICKADHTSTTNFNTDYTTKWTLLGQTTYIANWTANTEYRENQVILYNNMPVRAKETHTSASNFDTTKWELLSSNIKDYVSGQNYFAGEYVLYNGDLYRCKTTHVSILMPSDKWEVVLYSIKNWGESTSYDSNILALLHFDESVGKDEIGNTWNFSRRYLTSDYKKFGTACLPNSNNASPLRLSKSLSSLLGTTFSDSQFTMEFWVMTYDGNVAGGYKYYLLYSSTQMYSWVGLESGQYTIFLCDPYSVNYGNIELGTWYHVAITVDGATATSKTYFNGKLAQEINLGRPSGLNFETYMNAAQFDFGAIEGASYQDELVITRGIKYVEDFTPPDHAVQKLATYKQGQLCIYDHKLYRALADIQEEEFTESNWELIGGSGESSSSVVTTWTADTAYIKNQLIENNSKLYIVADNYTSGQTVETDIANEDLVPVSSDEITFATNTDIDNLFI